MCNTTSVYIFSALLDLGADPYKRTFEKKTVAELAEEYKRIDIINMLNYKEKRIGACIFLWQAVCLSTHFYYQFFFQIEPTKTWISEG